MLRTSSQLDQGLVRRSLASGQSSDLAKGRRYQTRQLLRARCSSGICRIGWKWQVYRIVLASRKDNERGAKSAAPIRETSQ